MLFNSVEFAIFLPVVAIVYFILEAGFKSRRAASNTWLILASYFYYMYADIRYGLLLLAVTLISYGSGYIMRYVLHETRMRKRVMILTVVLLIGTLFFFKYAGLLSSLVAKDRALQVILPVGISFYIFQSLTYVLGEDRDCTVFYFLCGFCVLLSRAAVGTYREVIASSAAVRGEASF